MILAWPGWKLFLSIALAALLVFLLQTLAGFALLILPSALVSWLPFLGLALATVVSLTLLFFFMENLPEWYDSLEEEILENLTVHGEQAVFRFSLLVGVNLMFWLGALLSLRWPFQLGILLGGTVLWLLLFELAFAFWVYGMQGFEEFFTAYQLPSILLGAGLACLLLLGMYGVSYWQERSSSPVEVQKNAWEKTQDMFSKIKETATQTWKKQMSPALEKAWKKSPLRPKIEEKMKQLDLEEMEVWLKNLQEQKTKEDLEKYLDRLEKYIREKK